MITKHFYKLSFALFLIILYFISKDYFSHKKAFDNKQTVNVIVLKTDCRKKGASYIDIQHNREKKFIEVLDGKCAQLQEGQNIIVLYSSLNDKYYWNKKPSTRIFYLYPLIIGLMIYCIILDIKMNRK